MIESAVVLLPLIGAAIAGLFGRVIGDRGAQVVTCCLMGLSALLSIYVFKDVAIDGHERVTELFTWIDSGSFEASWAVKLDTLSAVMLLVVSIVATLIHVYSIGYMAHDKSIPRFFSYLSLFTFFMLALVSADNLVQLFFGWEGVGLCSYLLIGFWYERSQRLRRGDQGLPGQPRGRHRLRDGNPGHLRAVRRGRLRGHLRRRAGHGRQELRLPRHRGPRDHHPLHPVVHRRHG